MSRPSLSARLRAAFLDDLDEQVAAMNADLLALEAAPGAAAPLRSLFRAAHTLKGAARAAGIEPVERLCHALEERLARARDGGSLTPGEFRLLFAVADGLAAVGMRMRAGADAGGDELDALHLAVERGEVPAPAPAPTEGGPAAPSTAAALEGRLRVGTEKLDALLASAGQLVLARGRVGAGVAELREMGERAARWESEWRRTGRALRVAVERSGAPAATVDALAAMDERMRGLARDAGRLADVLGAESRALGGATDRVAEDVRRLRMRPFSDAAEALPRAVRDLAEATGKKVLLRVDGAEVEADRAVIDGVREALIHLARNAVDHGIETPEERARAGKPPAGTLEVRAGLAGDGMRVVVRDDGRGFDVAAIRARLERGGGRAPEDDAGVLAALFEEGMSTRDRTTVVSGRGVGLGAVRAAMERVRGTVSAAPGEAGGAVFTLEAPLTLATVRALLACVGGTTVALPTAAVEHLVRVDPAALRRSDDRDVVLTPDGPVPVVSLAALLGPPLVARPPAGPLSVVLLRTDPRRVAVAVDELLGEEELMVRPIGTTRVPHLAGAAILPSGEVALVANAAEVVATGLAGGALSPVSAPAERRERAVPRILVADDSITTRTLEQATLEAAGYRVETAFDGADAWRILQERGADLVVSDVEMPRMDGFALCAAIRGSRHLAALPVILVTSLEKPEHRRRGMEAGADAYLGKSGFDQNGLLDTVRRLLGEGA